MQISHSMRLCSAIICGLALSGIASAQATMDHSAMGHTTMASGTSIAMTEGEVKKIDTKAQTITLKHGEIKNLNMPAMTMAFKTKAPAMLTQVKVGDKVRFKAEMTKDVLMLVTLEAAP